MPEREPRSSASSRSFDADAHAARPGGGADEFHASVVIDASGQIVAANRTASDLLGVPGKSLIGLPFTSRFAPENAEPGQARDASEWKSLCAAALDQLVAFHARREDGRTFPVRVQLERAFGGAGSYIAVIRALPDGRQKQTS